MPCWNSLGVTSKRHKKKREKKKSQWGIYLIALSKAPLICILIDMREVQNAGDARCGVLQTPRPPKRELAWHFVIYLDTWTVMCSLLAALCKNNRNFSKWHTGSRIMLGWSLPEIVIIPNHVFNSCNLRIFKTSTVSQ